MSNRKPTHRMRASQERYEAINHLAEAQGWKSVSQMLNALVDQYAAEVGFELPGDQIEWGGNRRQSTSANDPE